MLFEGSLRTQKKHNHEGFMRLLAVCLFSSAYDSQDRRMHVKEDKVLDANQWRVEAQAIIGDVRQHVRDLQISDDSRLRSSNRAIHLNLTTLEGLQFCVRLSPEGFSVVGYQHDCADNADVVDLQYFETIYALLDSISPQYRNSFGNSLLDRLQQLSDNQTR